MDRENGEDWRKICKDALHEKDPERLHILLGELAIALERRAARRDRIRRDRS
jgi:hypothetical protein